MIKIPFTLPKIGAKRIAIDWGSSALKIISASRLKHSYLITDFTYQKFEENLSDILSRIWQEKNFPLYNIVLSFDGPSTLLRVVDFPRMDKKMIRESLGYELSRYIPFSQEEVYYDFSVLDIETGTKNIKLLIASAQKNFVDEKLSLLEQANVIPSKITLSPISLVNAFLQFYPAQSVPIAILDLGFSYSVITIIYNNGIYLSREIKEGAKDILLRISNLLGVKITNFKDFIEKQKEIDSKLLLEISSNLIEDLRLSLDYLETKESLLVKKLYLTGGFTSCEGLVGILTKSLGIEVVPFNILKFFSCVSSIKERLEDLEGDLATAISTLLM